MSERTPPPDDQHRSRRPRQLTSLEGIRRTLAALEEAADDTDLPEEPRTLCGDAAFTIRSSIGQLEREQVADSIEDFARGELQPDPVSGRRISREPHDDGQGAEAQAEYDASPQLRAPL